MHSHPRRHQTRQICSRRSRVSRSSSKEMCSRPMRLQICQQVGSDHRHQCPTSVYRTTPPISRLLLRCLGRRVARLHLLSDKPTTQGLSQCSDSKALKESQAPVKAFSHAPSRQGLKTPSTVLQCSRPARRLQYHSWVDSNSSNSEGSKSATRPSYSSNSSLSTSRSKPSLRSPSRSATMSI